MLSVSGTTDWRVHHPGSHIGLLELTGVTNKGISAELETRKREAEARLRIDYQGIGREDLLKQPVMAAYKRYYKKFKKTYHVLLQLESIVNHDRDLPAVSPLVDSNFLAEMTTFVLTAGHDVAKLHPPLEIDVSREGEAIDQMGRGTKAIRAGDMVMRDSRGICCTIIYGQDNRSAITRTTDHVLYVSYAPPGVPQAVVRSQLESILDNIKLFSPTAKVEQCEVLVASGPA